MNYLKIAEILVSVIMTFLFMTTLSFLTVRQLLIESRAEARAEWDAFQRALYERNEVLPSISAAVRTFDAGKTREIQSLMEARAMLQRSSNPELIISAAEEIDLRLIQLEQLGKNNPKLETHPPFASHWGKLIRMSQRVAGARRSYNSTARLYNRLLKPFPQNIPAYLLGYTPLNVFKDVAAIGD